MSRSDLPKLQPQTVSTLEAIRQGLDVFAIQLRRMANDDTAFHPDDANMILQFARTCNAMDDGIRATYTRQGYSTKHVTEK